MLPHQGYYVAGPSVWWGYGSSGVPYPTMPEGSQWMHTTKEHVLNDQQKGNQSVQQKKRKYIKTTPSKQSNPHNQQNGNQLMHPRKVTYIQTTSAMEQQKGNQPVQQNQIKYMQTIPTKDYNLNDPKRGNVRYIHTMPAKPYTPTDQKKSNQMMLPKQHVQSMQIMPPREVAANEKGNQLMQNHIRLMQTLLPKDQKGNQLLQQKKKIRDKELRDHTLNQKKSTGTKEDNPNSQQKGNQMVQQTQLETMGPKEVPSKDKKIVNELTKRLDTEAAPLQENALSETQKENQQNRKRSLETTASNGNSGFSVEFPHQMEARREKRATYARNWYARLSEERKSESRRKKALYAREYRAKRLGLFPDGEEGTFAEQPSGVDGMASTPGMGNTEMLRSDEEERNVIDGKADRNRHANVALSLENVRARYCQRCFTEILEEQSQGYQTWLSMQQRLTIINHEGSAVPANTMENRAGKINYAETPEQFFACNAVVDGRQSIRNQEASAEIAKNNERKKKKARTMHLVEIAKQNARAKACQKETELARIKAESCITKTEACITKTEAKTEACITKTEACITKVQDKCVKKTQDKCIKKTQDKCVTKTYTTKSEIDAGLALMLLSEASSRHCND